MNNLFVFGCSYSAPYHKITERDTYGYILAEKLNMKPCIKAKSASGIRYSQNELIKSLPYIKNGDIIIFQFTFEHRLEFFGDIHNDGSYYSTAGFYKMNDIKNHPKNCNLRKHSELELELLLKYNSFWRIYEKPFLIKPIQEILHYLEKEKGVRYICMYVQHEEDIHFIDKNTIHLPTECCSENNGMMQFIADKQMSLGDEFPEEHHGDPHPGFEGHKELAKLLENTLL